ncbi:MAG: type II methionyl aminopeptidase [Candidatus Bathyarchaeia archaeon]|jgi:methionyl aminopeptidase|nr:type II methionyl aminopeptidase [Candidatus Bathyarchaeota archaeon A05DMB-4]MDH7595348.1 type II methionyl aminopeptidase [Candidatus Bathyarchaeota archaeon]
MYYSKEEQEKFSKAGEIARVVRETMRKNVQEEMRIVDVCEKAEELIRKLGGKPAFPCNVSINEVAAHYTSPPGDTKTVPKNSLVKLDIGVHVDGYVADTAVTVCFNREYDAMVVAAEEALKTAIETIRSGIFTSKLGSAVQKTIESYGFKPVSNLTGHQVGRFLVHAGKSLPNVFHLSATRLHTGEVYAIEPFVTLKDAVGKVESGKEITIFKMKKHKSMRATAARNLFNFIETNYRSLPFAERWLQKSPLKGGYKEAFHEIRAANCLTEYPIFVEASGKPVAQAEHTVFITENGCKVLT